MKKMHMRAFVGGLLLLCVIVANLTACTAKIDAKNLMKDVTPRRVDALYDIRSESAVITDFAIRLFQASEENGKNTLISPLSVLAALAMTLNGADGQTRAQIEAVLGMSAEELNLYFYSYMDRISMAVASELKLANSIWVTDAEDFTVEENFLQINADYFDADIYEAPFDQTTLRDINNWVKRETDGMIAKLLDNISNDAVMYLINALAFEGEWLEPYKKPQVIDGEFTKENGENQNVTYMYSEEGIYLEDEMTKGFVKYYKGAKFAFVALLPNEGISVSEYVASLTGSKVSSLLASGEYECVHASIPKFSTEYEMSMLNVLGDMGITDAFDSALANFSRLGHSASGNLVISEIYHKTSITVDEAGTKASAATSVEVNSRGMEPLEPKEVYLDRPFVYMLIDLRNNLPFFIGTVMEIEQ